MLQILHKSGTSESYSKLFIGIVCLARDAFWVPVGLISMGRPALRPGFCIYTVHATVGGGSAHGVKSVLKVRNAPWLIQKNKCNYYFFCDLILLL